MDEVEQYVATLEERLLCQPCEAEQVLSEAETAPSARVVREDFSTLENRLFCDQPASYNIKHERPEHRVIVFLKAQGMSNKEVSERTGFTTVMIGYVLKQPWARVRLLQEITEMGRDGMAEILKGAAVDSVLTLLDVRDSEKSRPSDKIAAANSLLDRYLGKPTQRVESINTNVNASMCDVKKMQAELVEVEAELTRVTGGTRN